MTVELEKPFVFPAEPSKEEHSNWHSEEMQKRIDTEKLYEARGKSHREKGTLTTPTMRATEGERKMLAKQAKDILEGKVKWSNQRTLDPRWQTIPGQGNGLAAGEVAANVEGKVLADKDTK